MEIQAHNKSILENQKSDNRLSSNYSDAIRLSDILSFLKDVQKFLEKLDHEDGLSLDCKDLKKSLISRIHFYTKLASRPESGVYSSLDLPPPPAIDEIQSSQQTYQSRKLYPTMKRGSDPLPPPPINNDQDDSLGYCTGEQSLTDVSGDFESEDYDVVQSPSSMALNFDSLPPALTSTPKGKRHSSFSEQISNNNANSNDVIETFAQPPELQDNTTDTPLKSSFVGTSAKILNSLSEHKGWLWKKESLFKTPRFWALVYSGKLYLYNECHDLVEREMFLLEGATLKRHKKGVKFIINVSGTYKNKNARQEFQAENTDQTNAWITALENAIATADKPIGLATKSELASSFSSESQEVKKYDATENVSRYESSLDMEEDDEYDVVEVNRSSEYQDYDIPKRKSETAKFQISSQRRSTKRESKQSPVQSEKTKGNTSYIEMVNGRENLDDNIERKSNQRLSLSLRHQMSLPEESQTKPELPPRKCMTPLHSPNDKFCQPPMPLPRKISLQKSNVKKQLFIDDETDLQESSDMSFYDEDCEMKPKRIDYCSKTLQKPKKKKAISDSEVRPFRQRNKSESGPKPHELVSNELEKILEKRRKNLADGGDKRPEIPTRPSHLALAETTKDNFPPYSKVNKPKMKLGPSMENVQCKMTLPEKSFLHSLLQTGKLDNSFTDKEM